MAGQKNDHLIQELRLEMEEELDKGPVEMDTEKIKQINLLLAKLENRDTLPQDMELESFLQRFDKKHGIDLLAPFKTSQPMNSPKRKSSWRVRAVVAMIAVVVMAGIGNAASVAAMDKSLWQIIKETTHGVYFRTLQSKGEVIEKGVGEHYEIYSDWEALEESMGIGILLPEYIPDGLELEMIEKNIFENSEEIMAYYYNGDIQLSISCEYYTIKGDFYKNKGGNKILGQQSQIGGRNVYISIEDDINIIFIEDDVIYTIDTNLDLEEAEKVVENLR